MLKQIENDVNFLLSFSLEDISNGWETSERSPSRGNRWILKNSQFTLFYVICINYIIKVVKKYSHNICNMKIKNTLFHSLHKLLRIVPKWRHKPKVWWW